MYILLNLNTSSTFLPLYSVNSCLSTMINEKLLLVRFAPSPPFYGVFAKCKNLVFSLGTAKNPLGTHKFTTPARVLSDDTFEFASKWEYVFAVVEKSLCPSHTCMSFNVIPFVLPLFNSNDAQVCRRS